MKIFLSWSGQRSHALAEALVPWLKQMIQSADPWISSEMERGVKWLAEIGEKLDTHSLSIICVTPGNKNRPWINFEAGALSKHLGSDGRVIPYLLDFNNPGDLAGPLSQFNACVADREGTLLLVKTLNRHAEYPLDEGALLKQFGAWWPELEEKIERITQSSPTQRERRSDSDKIDDILEVVRATAREVGGLTTEPDFYNMLTPNGATAIDVALQGALQDLVEFPRAVHVAPGPNGGLTVFVADVNFPLAPMVKRAAWDTVHMFLPSIPSGQIGFGETKVRSD